MTIQTTIRSNELKALSGKTVVTLYVPLQRGPLGHKQNTSQFHAIRADLKKQLSPVDHNILSDAFEKVIQTLGYVNSYEGLLVVLGGGEVSVYSLPFKPELEVSVSTNVSMQQLNINNELNKPFYVLAITKKGSKLYSGDMESLHSVPVKDLDQTLEQALRLEEGDDANLQNHPSGMGGKHVAGFHGHGGLKDVKKTLYEAYLRTVDKKIMAAIQNKKIPLVVVAVGYGHSMYEKISKYPTILKGGITESPENVSPSQLHAKTLPLFS